MNIPATTALVPVKRLIPPLTRINGNGDSLDFYAYNYRNQAVFTVFPGDDTDSSPYGPNGTKIFYPQKAEFIDIYI